MARKRWTKKEEETPSLLKFREKRKWQIALRRYVIEQAFCYQYAPYFGLDIKNMRNWFELQFTTGLTWVDFGDKWQFDHIIPVTYFDFSIEQELLLCWNFINLRVEPVKNNKDRGNRVDILMAEKYFRDIYEHTGHPISAAMLDKIRQIEISEIVSADTQKEFIKAQDLYLNAIKDYTAYEFEQLNRGRTIQDIENEMNLLKNLKG